VAEDESVPELRSRRLLDDDGGFKEVATYTKYFDLPFDPSFGLNSMEDGPDKPLEGFFEKRRDEKLCVERIYTTTYSGNYNVAGMGMKEDKSLSSPEDHMTYLVVAMQRLLQRINSLVACRGCWNDEYHGERMLLMMMMMLLMMTLLLLSHRIVMMMMIPLHCCVDSNSWP